MVSLFFSSKLEKILPIFKKRLNFCARFCKIKLYSCAQSPALCLVISRLWKKIDGGRAPCTIKKGEESCQTDCFRVSSTRCVIPSTVPSALWMSPRNHRLQRAGKIGEVCEEITPEEMASVDVFQTDEYSFKSFGSRPRPEYAVFVAGKDPEAQKYVKILAVSLNRHQAVLRREVRPGQLYQKRHPG